MIEERQCYVGYIYGMSHDQIQYATQASEAMFIIDREKMKIFVEQKFFQLILGM